MSTLIPLPCADRRCWPVPIRYYDHIIFYFLTTI